VQRPVFHHYLDQIKSRFDSQIDVSCGDTLEWPGRALALCFARLIWKNSTDY
jgi:hypothetical protein